MLSRDGANWFCVYDPEDGGYYSSVCWSPELHKFVAVSYGGQYDGATSTDGIVWEGFNAPIPCDWRSVCWSSRLGKFVAVATEEDSNIMVSSDGTTWTNYTSPVNGGWTSVCWS
jgi:hypothetical protein